MGPDLERTSNSEEGDVVPETLEERSSSESNISEDDDVAPDSPVPAVPRRSRRNRKPPEWLNSTQYDLFKVFAESHNNFSQMLVNLNSNT